MTFGQLNPGAIIHRIGEDIHVTDIVRHTKGVHTRTDFRVVRGCCKDGLWVTAQQVQQWLDTAQAITNPEEDS